MVNYSIKDDLQRAVEKMEELQSLIDQLKPVMPRADHNRLVDLAGEVAARMNSYNSCILRAGDKAQE